MARKILGNSRGQSLIQVMVSAAIMGIVMMTTVGMQANQARENTALTEKLASMDLFRSATAALSSPLTCGLIFSTIGNLPNPAVVPATLDPANPYRFAVNSIPRVVTAKGFNSC